MKKLMDLLMMAGSAVNFLIDHCELRILQVIFTFMGALVVYAVYRYESIDRKAKRVKVEPSKMSFMWTTSMAQICVQRSPEIVYPEIGKCYLEVRPADDLVAAGAAFHAYLNLRNVFSWSFLWNHCPFRKKTTVDLSFKLSVLCEKFANFQNCGGLGKGEPSVPFVLVEETLTLDNFKIRLGPFAMDKEYVFPEKLVTFVVEIIFGGTCGSGLNADENLTDSPREENQDTESQDETVHEEAPIDEYNDREGVDSSSDARVELQRLRDALREVLGRREFSDLRITIGGRNFHVHKAILAVRCPSIMRDLPPGDNNVTLEDVDPDVFGVALDFMYSGEIEGGRLELICGDLLRVAVRLQMNELKSVAEDSLLRSLNTANVSERVQIAYECDSTDLKEPILQFINAHKKEILLSQEWRSVNRCSHAKEILFDLLNTF